MRYWPNVERLKSQRAIVGIFLFISSSVLRKIIHIDMDAFFASVEQRDFPELRGKAVAVGGGGNRGVVAAASYEARKFGVRSAMPSVIAQRKCPHLIFVKHRFDVYRSTSLIIRSIFKEYTDLVEPLSLDEAYLDVTENKKQMLSATHIAQEIKQRIYDQTNLVASAGVSFNKFLAKIASDYDKPDGLYVITPEEAENFIEQLSINKFFGIGKKTEERMRKMGIFKGKDLKKMSKEGLKQRFGKAGNHYYNICRAVDNRSVIPFREAKSIGAENTFGSDVATIIDVKEKLDPIIGKVSDRLEKRNRKGKTVTLKIKYSNFDQVTRSKTLLKPLSSAQELREIIFELLEQESLNTSVRLLGVSVSNFEKEIIIPQMTLGF